MKHLEIERKWLVSGFPNMPHVSETLQEQGYLAFAPVAVRIRKTTDAKQNQTFVLCFKGPGGLVRSEVEQNITKETYQALKQMLPCPTASKRHRTYLLPGGHLLECSLVDEGQASAFFYAELEFATAQAAHSFVPPAFLQQEITGQPGSSMAEYCRQKAAQKNQKPL